jgi:hypothetical protein
MIVFWTCIDFAVIPTLESQHQYITATVIFDRHRSGFRKKQVVRRE